MKHVFGLLLRSLLAVAIALDLLASALTGGSPWQTISARLGRSLPHCRFCDGFCALLSRLLGKDHCQESWRVYQDIDRITGD